MRDAYFVAKSPGPSQLPAIKFIMDQLKDSKPVRGRPSKLEKQNALKKEIDEETALEEDSLRIGLSTLTED